MKELEFIFQRIATNGKAKCWENLKTELNLAGKLYYIWMELTDTFPGT